MYTKKQKALFRGFCYACASWLTVGYIASEVLVYYRDHYDSSISPHDIASMISPYVFLIVGTPIGIFGYLQGMKK